MAGLLGNSYDPYGGMSSLLGVDMDAMRKQALWNGLAAAGFSLMGNKNMGAAGGAFLLGTNQARDDYMNTALDAYRLKQAEEQQAYQRDRDAAADERWQTQWDYNVGRDAQADERQSRQDAWTNTQNQRTMEDWQRQDDQRQQQQDYVTGWMGQQEQAGVNVLPPNVRDIARQGGVQGMVSPVDEWRYGQAQPYAGMGDYENAFKGITAQPPKPEQFTLGAGDVRYDEYGNPIAVGPGATPKAPTVETFFDPQTGQQYKAQWDEQSQQWVPVGGRKASEGGITITNPDGTVTQIGGSGAKSTEGDRRAASLYDQISKQEPELMAGFDALANPQNYAGAQIPGGSAIMSSEAQVAADALTNVVANWLYLTSGATATDAEIERQTSMVTPTPFDSPQRVAAKKARLKQILDTMKGRAGVQGAPAPADEGWTTLPDGTRIRQKGQ